jgi:hypothetical protein
MLCFKLPKQANHPWPIASKLPAIFRVVKIYILSINCVQEVLGTNNNDNNDNNFFGDDDAISIQGGGNVDDNSSSDESHRELEESAQLE